MKTVIKTMQKADQKEVKKSKINLLKIGKLKTNNTEKNSFQ